AHAGLSHQRTGLKALAARAGAFRFAITQTKALEPLAAPSTVNAPATARYAVLALASRNPRHRSGHQIAKVVTGNDAPLRVFERIERERPRGVILDPTLIRAKRARVVSARTTIDVWLVASETCRIGRPNLRLFALLAIFQNSFRKPLNAAHSVLLCSEKKKGADPLQMKRTAARQAIPSSAFRSVGRVGRSACLFNTSHGLHLPS